MHLPADAARAGARAAPGRTKLGLVLFGDDGDFDVPRCAGRIDDAEHDRFAPVEHALGDQVVLLDDGVRGAGRRGGSATTLLSEMVLCMRTPPVYSSSVTRKLIAGLDVLSLGRDVIVRAGGCGVRGFCQHARSGRKRKRGSSAWTSGEFPGRRFHTASKAAPSDAGRPSPSR